MAPADTGSSRDSVPTGKTLNIILAFLSLSLYNVVELNYIIWATFKRRGGLYFWSFIVATWGIPPYAVGFLVKSLQLGGPGWAYVTLIVVGWCCMVTGQSCVLYSRLHIVLRNDFQLRLVLGMIVTNAIICHIPTTIMIYGANSTNPEPFIVPYSVMERIQVTLFFVQETIISALYIHETIGLIRLRRRGGLVDVGRRLMAHLVVVNVIIVMLDITILALEYAGLYELQTSYKALVYSVKLKLEFSILNRLVEVTTGRSTTGDSSYTRTRGDVVGVELEDQTLNRERRKKKTADNSMGNSVFVGSNPGAGADGAKNTTGASVVMTTEVSIHRERIRSYSDGQADLESIGGRSGVTVDSTVGGTVGQVHVRAPSQSSQRPIVDAQ
ncbi:hypothetical protein VTI74DRAFT_9110 [Chaetomium olivicolor]